MKKLTKRQKKDLIKLADHVEANVPLEEFNMGYWGAKLRLSCGSVGCLAFHAIQVFPKRLKTEWDGMTESYRIVNRKTGSMGTIAFEDAFGPGTGDLCLPASEAYRRRRSPLTPKKVAACIRKFVKGN